MIRSCQKCRKPFSADEEWKKICLPCWIKGRNDEKNVNKEKIDAVVYRDLDGDLLKKLIYLCHPDKHNGSAMSNEVTKLLLSIKKK